MTKTEGKMNIPARIAALAAVSAAVLALLRFLGILNLRLFGAAFSRGNGAIGLAAAALLAMTAVALFRYRLILRIAAFKARTSQIIAAGLISQAVGQWAPGSVAITEIVRFGLLAGLNEGSKGRLGLSILIDRLLGLGTMFLVGGFAALELLLRRGILVKYPALVVSLAVVSLALGLALILSPLLTRTSPWRSLSRFLAAKTESGRPGAPGSVPRKRLRARMAESLNDAVQLLNGAAARPRLLLVPLILSMAIPFLNGATLFYAAVAIGHPLPLSVILAAVPFTVLAVFLPLGIAGFGGPQLVAAGVFGLFNVSSETVVAACLVQNTIVLSVTTVLGGLSAWFAVDRLRAALADRKNRLSDRRSP